jgi:hypothetical protein
MKVPVDDDIINAISSLVDDAQSERRDPSHSDIEFEIKRAGLSEFDPKKTGSPPLGKTKRIRQFLFSAFEVKPDLVEKFTTSFLSTMRTAGGFRVDSPNYVGKQPIENLILAFKRHGVIMTLDGLFVPAVLENLSSHELTQALENYIIRAKRGLEDAALIVGTSKDLLEAVAAHVINEMYGSYSTTLNFPTLLYQAFNALGLVTSGDTVTKNEHPRKAIERNMYDLACSINKLRNKQGTGHGRPWLPDVTPVEAICAVESMGVISELLLKKLKIKQRK